MPIQWTRPSNAATFSYRVLEALEAPTTAERWKLQQKWISSQPFGITTGTFAIRGERDGVKLGSASNTRLWLSKKNACC